MRSADSVGHVSVIGPNYLYPIAKLLEALEELSSGEPNEVQASLPENGFSTAIIVLTVLLAESIFNRTQHVRGDRPPKKAIEFLRTYRPLSVIRDKVEELFVVRDVVVHNHLWNTQISWDENLRMQLVSTERVEGYGDSKYERVLDPRTRKSRLLGLNLVPVRLCRADAVIVLKQVMETLLLLEKVDRDYVYITHQVTNYQGRMVNFVELVESL